MILNNETYYSREANLKYMSVSQLKTFTGTYGRLGCEFQAMEELAGRWNEEPSTAMMIGSYVDSWAEGTLEQFEKENPSIFKKDGTLKADYAKAEEIIARIKRDEYFMKYLSGEKQKIMTGELFGTNWKIKMDSYIPGVAIVDLKVVKAVDGKDALNWVRDFGYLPWYLYWGYDIQGAVYQKIVEINTGKKLPFYLAAVSKENKPSIRIIQIMQHELDEALAFVEANLPRALRVKNGAAEPDRCEVCDCCRETRVLSKPICSADLMMGV